MSNKLKTEAKNYFEKEFSTIHFSEKQWRTLENLQ